MGVTPLVLFNYFSSVVQLILFSAPVAVELRQMLGVVGDHRASMYQVEKVSCFKK